MANGTRAESIIRRNRGCLRPATRLIAFRAQDAMGVPDPQPVDSSDGYSFRHFWSMWTTRQSAAIDATAEQSAGMCNERCATGCEQDDPRRSVLVGIAPGQPTSTNREAEAYPVCESTPANAFETGLLGGTQKTRPLDDVMEQVAQRDDALEHAVQRLRLVEAGINDRYRLLRPHQLECPDECERINADRVGCKVENGPGTIPCCAFCSAPIPGSVYMYGDEMYCTPSHRVAAFKAPSPRSLGEFSASGLRASFRTWL